MKIIKNPVFTFILGIIITSSISVVASTLLASSITYDNTTSGLKDSNNQDVTTVQEAIDVLYSRSNTFGITANKITFGVNGGQRNTSRTASLTNLEEGRYLVINTVIEDGYYCSSNTKATYENTNKHSISKTKDTTSCTYITGKLASTTGTTNEINGCKGWDSFYDYIWLCTLEETDTLSVTHTTTADARNPQFVGMKAIKLN